MDWEGVEALYLLEIIDKEWTNFMKALQKLYEPLIFMESRFPPLPSLKDNGVLLWRQIITLLDSMLIRFLDSIFYLVKDRRDKNSTGPWCTDHTISTIRRNILMLRDLGGNVYESFENLYLEDAAHYYAEYSQRSLANSVRFGSYLPEVESCLENAEDLQDPTAMSKILTVVIRQMTHNDLEDILGGLPDLLQQNKCDDLKRICKLLKGVPFGFESMCDTVYHDLYALGKERLAEKRGKGFVAFVQCLMGLQADFNRHSAQSFHGERRLQMAVDIRFCLAIVICWSASS